MALHQAILLWYVCFMYMKRHTRCMTTSNNFCSSSSSVVLFWCIFTKSAFHKFFRTLNGNSQLTFFPCAEKKEWEKRVGDIISRACFSGCISSHSRCCYNYQYPKISLSVWNYLERTLWWPFFTSPYVEGLQALNLALMLDNVELILFVGCLSWPFSILEPLMMYLSCVFSMCRPINQIHCHRFLRVL